MQAQVALNAPIAAQSGAGFLGNLHTVLHNVNLIIRDWADGNSWLWRRA
jgi:hypothetical protein